MTVAAYSGAAALIVIAIVGVIAAVLLWDTTR